MAEQDEKNEERVELKLDLKHSTQDAYLVSDGSTSTWLPR